MSIMSPYYPTEGYLYSLHVYRVAYGVAASFLAFLFLSAWLIAEACTTK
jgi:hypothetical protein